MLEYDFEASIGYWTVLAAHALERALNEELAPQGITFQQWQVLAWIALEGDLTQKQLAERMRIEAPTLAGILDRMQRAGWIRRVTDPADRRKKVVRVMPCVGPVWECMVDCAHRVRARAIEGVSREELDITRQTLGKLLSNLAAPSPSSNALPNVLPNVLSEGSNGKPTVGLQQS